MDVIEKLHGKFCVFVFHREKRVYWSVDECLWAIDGVVGGDRGVSWVQQRAFSRGKLQLYVGG